MACGNPNCGCGDGSHGGCGNPNCGCAHKQEIMNNEEKIVINEENEEEVVESDEAEESSNAHEHVDPTNPFANLDEETQAKIQELQMLEQNFQQLLMQKNAFSMELNETDLIVKEVEKTSGEVSRIIGNQVVIKATKEEILSDMNEKKELLEKRMKSIDDQEKEFSERMESLREEVIKKVQG